MKLNPATDRPYGANIHFAFSVGNMEFLYLHQGLQTLLDVSGNNLNTGHFSHMLSADMVETLERTYNALLAGRYYGFTELRMDTKQGTVWLRILPLLVEDEGNLMVLGSASDISDEIKNNDALVKFANKKNSILQMLSHDLKGPLGVAKNVLKMIEQEYPEPDLQRKTNYLVKVMDDSISLIDSLIMRELMETTDVALVKKRVDLVRLMLDYVEECRRSAEIAQRNFQFNSIPKELWLEMDNAKFMQVINNLVTNALKFTEPGGTISVLLEEKETEVLLSLSDDGIGIPRHLMPELFSKFSPAARPGLRGEKSTGLGLSIVKTIIEWHDGQISCESTEGSGTTFVISLPKPGQKI